MFLQGNKSILKKKTKKKTFNYLEKSKLRKKTSRSKKKLYWRVKSISCAIRYYLYNLKNVKNTHGGVLILVKLQAEACNFTKINTPPWVFFTFFKLYKWYQIAQRITYNHFGNIFDWDYNRSFPLMLLAWLG